MKPPDLSRPLNAQQERALRGIARARSYLLVCFYTLPLYIGALLLLLNNGRSITGFMFVYMAVYAVFAVNMAVRRCPRCYQQFFVRHIFLNMVTKRCTHCNQPLQSGHLEKF